MTSSTNIANIEIKGIKKGKPKLNSEGCILPFYKTKKSLNDLQVFNSFIKNTEAMIRNSKEYKAYKNHLMKDLGLNHCMVFPNISNEVDDKITIEMHHGPILTLYDYCTIITKYCLKNDIPVTSFRISKMIIDEHNNDNVQVVMLCDLAHKLFHDQQIYINPRQAWGNLDRFINKYRDGISDKLIDIINKNIDIAQKSHSIDRDDILKLDYIEKWNKE